MKSNTALGLVGFTVGGLLMCYLEWRPAPQETAAAPSPASDIPTITRATSPTPAGRRAAPARSNHKAQPMEEMTPIRRDTGARADNDSTTDNPNGRNIPTQRGSGPRPQAGQPPARAGAMTRAEPGPVRRPRPSGAVPETPPRPRRPVQHVNGIRIRRVLVGGQVAAAGVVSTETVEDQGRDGKYLVYFDIDASGAGGAPRYDDFRLEDRKGLLYAPIRTRDALGADRPEHQRSGGVAFAVYNDAGPARLLCRSGSGSFAPIPEAAFQRP